MPTEDSYNGYDATGTGTVGVKIMNFSGGKNYVQRT